MKTDELETDRHYLTEDGKIMLPELFKEVGQVNSLLLGVMHQGVSVRYGSEQLSEFVEDIYKALDGVEENIIEALDGDEEAAHGLMIMGILLKLSRTMQAEAVDAGWKEHLMSMN